MANAAAAHETVLDAGTAQARIARVYAEALLASALKESPEAAEQAGTELGEFVRSLAEHPEVAAFLANPTVGKKARAAALDPALKDRASSLLRGFVGVLALNNRLPLLRNIAAAYQRLLDVRAGRVPVKVSTAVELSDEQRERLTGKLRGMLRGEPVLNVVVNPDLIGGMIVQVGDAVIDTSVRSRLQSIRARLLSQ